VAEANVKSEPCPKCRSRNVEPVDRKGEMLSAIGTTVIGFLLSLVFAPVLILVIPAGIYLVYTAATLPPTMNCLDCRKRWRPSTESSGEG
jgi:ABC-type uncharacterized transport system permease subunit